MLHDAIAASVKEVSDAFMAGKDNHANPSAAAHWEAIGLKYIGSTEHLSKRQAVENTCPLYIVDGGAVKIRGDTLQAFPRPAAAKTNGFGSSLRWTMSHIDFPPIVDITTVRGGVLAQADAAFDIQYPAGTTCTDYRDFKKRNPLLPDDCCAVAGRSVPQYVADPLATARDADASPATKWPSTAAGTDPARRVTYKNTCYVSQNAAAAAESIKTEAGKAATAVVDGGKAVGSAVVTGAKAVGNAVASGAHAVGEFVADAAVAYAEGQHAADMMGMPFHMMMPPM